MKKIILFALAITSLIICNSQNPQWINYTNGKEVRAVAEEGNFLWLATNGGLVKVDKQTNETTFFNRANSGLPTNNLFSIAVDQDGNKWIGTQGEGLAKFDGIDWTVYNMSNSGLAEEWHNAIAIDNIGNKWIATYNGGLVKFDGIDWTVYNTSNSGLPKNWFKTIAVDRNGNKWIGGYSLAVFNENGVELSAEDNLLNKIDNGIVKVYPNPSNEYLNIELSNEVNIIGFEILDLQGRIMKTIKTNTNYQTIDISNLPEGLYILKIHTTNGFEFHKIIKS